MTTMADLEPGTRVRLDGGDEGVIRVRDGSVVWHPDDLFGDLKVTEQGPVFPADLEILRPAAKPLCDMTGQEFADYMGALDEQALSAREAGTSRADILRRGEDALAEVNARRWGVPYRLYKGQAACDSDDWGPPVSMHRDLFDAMWAAAANGVPLSCWKTDPHCPDEVFTETTPQWTILGPGAAAQAEAMRVPPATGNGVPS